MRASTVFLTSITLLGFTARPSVQPAVQFDFGPPTNLGNAINGPTFDGGQSISVDGRSLYFTSDRPGGSGGGDLWVTRRVTPTDPFGAPQNLGAAVNGPANEFAPSISADGLSIFFDSDRPGGLGLSDIWVATRATTSEAFGAARNLGASVNTSAGDGLPSISGDGLALYFSSPRDGGSGKMDLWVARRTTSSEPFGQAVNLGSVVNSEQSDWGPGISADELHLFFMSDRPGGQGREDIWVTSRVSRASAFGAPRNLGSVVNSSALDARPNISADGATLFFMSDRPGGSGQIDLWLAANRVRVRPRP